VNAAMDDFVTPEFARNRPTHVVGVGASAGGLESLQRFFAAVPVKTGLAFVIVQHLAPDQKSLMVELLGKHASIEICQASHGAYALPDRAYLIPPGYNLEIREGALQLSLRLDAGEHRRSNYAVDQFFRSLALDCAERCVGVILSGTGSDGSYGALAIKAAGGLVLAEDPDSAKFNGMPSSAVRTGAVSRVAGASDLPAEILRHVGLLEADAKAPKEGLSKVLALVSDHTGVQFDYYKRSTIGRRVERRKIATETDTLNDYADLLERSEGERNLLASDLFVGVTTFFRDPVVFESLRQVVRDLVRDMLERRQQLLRVWTPGCSSGEEAYSVAMLLHEVMEECGERVQLKVFATDVNPAALEIAARGRYSPSIETEIGRTRLERFFVAEADGVHIRQFLRDAIVFARHDLLRDPPFTRIDLVLCRNLLIYFTPDAQKRANGVFQFALRPGGVLVLGTSETPGPDAVALEPIDAQHRIYRLAKDTGLLRELRFDLIRDDLDRERVHPTARPALASRMVSDPSTRLLEATLNWVGLPILIVNQSAELVFAFGAASKHLRVPTGRAAWRLDAMLPQRLGMVVASIVADAVGQGQEMLVRGVEFEQDGTSLTTDIRAVPLPGVSLADGGVALVFEGLTSARDGQTVRETPVDQVVQARIGHLELELAVTRARLQRAVEELETSNEELQATNEEIVSSNEELQSTNEELQSLNEELHTVNAELQAKVEEVGIINADLTNLLSNTEAGLLFLDLDGRVRRFNERLREIIRLVPHDIGRSVGDIVHMLVDIDLAEACHRVIRSLIGVDREVRSQDGRTFVLRLRPFHTDEGDVQGVVLTSHDISALVDANRRLDVYSRMSEQSPAMHVITDAHGCIEYTNGAYLLATGWQSEDLLGADLRGQLAERNGDDVGIAVRRALDRGEPWMGHLWLRTSSSSPLRVRASLFPVCGTDGRITHLVKTAEPDPV